MPTARTGFVALLDALGTKGVWLGRALEEVVAERDAFLELAQTMARDQSLYLKVIPAAQGRAEPSIDSHFDSFSDSFVLTLWSDEPARILVNQFANQLIEIYYMAIEKGMLLRGAIAYGPYCHGTKSLIGPAVDEADLWSHVGEWAGVICSPTASSQIAAIAGSDEVGLDAEFTHWSVPTTAGKALSTWVLDWPRHGQRPKIEGHFLRPPVRPEVDVKRRNTLDFYDSRIDKIYQRRVGAARPLQGRDSPKAVPID